MRETIRAIETGALAEIAILAFVVAFVAVCAYAFTLTKRQREDAKHLPLDSLPRVDRGDAPPAPTTPASGDGAATSSDDLLIL